MLSKPSPNPERKTYVARAKPGTNVLVDPALKKQFIEMRDHWSTLNDRANSAASKRRQYQAEIKTAGFKMQQVKDSLQLMTPEGEADFKAEIANRLLAAAYSDADIGDQLSLFLDHNRTPAVDRAYKEGQTRAMENKTLECKYAPETDQYAAFVEGYHAEQARLVTAGIGKLDTAAAKENAKAGKKGGKGPKAGKTAKAAPARPAGKRGRPPGPAKAKAPDAPPRRPTAQPVTRATLAANKAVPESAGEVDADSYFSKSAPAGNA